MSTSLSTLSWLPEDLTGLAATNFVKNEVHKSQTTGALSRFVIMPAQGAFYDTDNLQVVYHTATADTVLQRDNDYRLIGIDFGRTKVSSAQGGVYHFILITTVFNYDPTSYITIDYQAFGGYLSYRAYTMLIDAINDVAARIATDSIITADNIGDNVIIKTLTRELQALCMRIQYAPTVKHVANLSYEDVTNWNTIAVSKEAYDRTIDFEDPSTLQGTAVVTIASPYLDMKIALHYDLTPAQEGISYGYEGKLSADVLYQRICSYDAKTTLNDEDFFNENRMCVPKFRIMVERDGSTGHKVYLQMALLSTDEGSYELSLTDSSDIQITDLANQYILTEDTVFVADKVYYTRQGADGYYTYTKATVTPGEAVTPDTYYELSNVAQIPEVSLIGKFDLVSKGSASAPTPSPSTDAIPTNTVIGLKQPYLMWQGCVPAAFVQTVSYAAPVISGEYGVEDNLTPIKETGCQMLGFFPGKCLRSEAITQIACEIYDRYTTNMIRVVLPASYENYLDRAHDERPVVTARGSFFEEDNCEIAIQIRMEDDTLPKRILVYASLGMNSYVNDRFDIRAIYYK